MYLLLNSSSPHCKLYFYVDNKLIDKSWQADRSLADDLLSKINQGLEEIQKKWQDITAVGVYKGPGSFTGLRIGITVLNTISDSLKIPIVGTNQDDWIEKIIERLEKNENDQMIIPEYGMPARITLPKK